MLTPQEVAEHSFAKASFNGYNMAQVDDFLDEVTRDYETLYSDNTLLKQKLAVLSGKIKEYQSTEEAMRKTLLTAQTMADEIVKEAEDKRAALLNESEAEVRARIQSLAAEEQAQKERLRTAAAATEQFVAKVREMISQQTTLMDGLESIVPAVVPQPSEDKLTTISEAVSQALETQKDAPDADATVAFDLSEVDLSHQPTEDKGKNDRRANLFADLGSNFGREAELK